MKPEKLHDLGLTEDQSNIYLTLLEHGTQPAGRISLRSSLKRGLVYKVLEQLEELRLIEKIENPGKVTRFSPLHPSHLYDLIEQKEKQTETAKQTLETLTPELTSSFNRLSGKPNIQFYEGTKGMEEVLDDSLYAKDEILTYVDLEAIQKFIPKVNEDYVEKRKKFNISKRGIVVDTPFNRKVLQNYAKGVTQAKLIGGHKIPPFQTIMQIYDKKISYLTLTNDYMIGVIIKDKHIFDMHKFLFNHLWDQTPETKI